MRGSLKTVLLRVGIIAYGGLCLGAFWLGWRFSEDGYRAWDISSNAYQVALGPQGYHHEHGVFPPTKYQPVAGGPIHSWRVLVVPYSIGGPEGYDFSQEWNSPHNLQVLGGVWPGRFFRSKRDSDNSDIATILAIGEDDEWPSKKPLRALMLKEGKDRFLLIDDPDSQVHWMEPRY